MPSGPAGGLSPDEAGSLFTAVIADILDQAGYPNQVLPPRIRPLSPGLRVLGRAMPVVITDGASPNEHPYGLLTEALDQLQSDEVYVASGGEVPCAVWGEILTATARKRGAVGAIIDGYHRDTGQVLATGWPVFSRGAFAADSDFRAAVTAYRVPIRIDDVAVNPDDLVVADDDGVVIVPAAVEAKVLERALAKITAENEFRAAIEAGMTSTEAFRRYGVL